MMAPRPMRTNWWMPESPPMITPSSMMQWPAIADWLATTTWLPTIASWPTCAPVIKRLSSPTRVIPPPPSVPVFMVTPSRMRLRLPTISCVFSPAYFKSCGISPIFAKGKITVSAPISVNPVTTAWDLSTTPSCKVTSGPTWQNGPIWQPAAIFAPLSTTADGWIEAEGSIAITPPHPWHPQDPSSR